MRRLQKIKQRTVRTILPHWEHVSEKYYPTVSAFPMSYSVGRSIIEFCEEMRINPEESQVLIVGAHGGRDYHWLTGFGYRVDILDLGDHEWGETRYVGDACRAETWNQIDRTYDLIVMHDVLEHLPEDFAALRHARKVLKDTGFLFISVPYRHDPEITHVRSYSEVTLTRLLNVAGYNAVWKRDRPGMLEAFPRVVNGVNYAIAVLMVSPDLGAAVLKKLLGIEYAVNNKTRRIYRVLGRSPQKGVTVAAKPTKDKAIRNYVAVNKDMFTMDREISNSIA